MRLPLSPFVFLVPLFASVAATGSDLPSARVHCTLAASGGDDAPQFLRAVRACPVVTIPASTTIIIQTRLDMTGLRNRHIKLQGKIRFDPDIPYWTGNAFFIPFQTQVTFWLLGGENILFDGGGTLDGAGQAWWDSYVTNTSLLRPITLTIYQAKNALVHSIQMINGPEWFNLVNEGEHVIYKNISISAVSTSNNMPRNSDGWDIYRSNDVTIVDSIIHNDDDCVSFKPNSTNVRVENLDCTGSHGISVGSLGQYPGVYDIVENVFVKNIKMANAQNGARVKAWAGPNVGSGTVKNITFQNFIETAVDNPVVIDQCYMTNTTACAQFPSNIYIQDIWFNNITGTGTRSVVASLLCSPDGRCSNINVNDFSLSYPAGMARYSCQNVNLTGNAASLFSPCTVT